LLPQLKGTAIDPIELWDVAGDGITVKQPNLASLTIDDIVLLLPSKREIVEDIVTKLKTTKCNNIMRLDDILLHSRIREYPRFYDGSIKFESKLLTGE